MIRNTLLGPGRPQMTIWRMRIAYWMPKATSIISEYVILIDFPLQKWLEERASLLRRTYIVRRVEDLNFHVSLPALTLRRLMSYIYIYGATILDVSRSHTTTQHSR